MLFLRQTRKVNILNRPWKWLTEFLLVDIGLDGSFNACGGRYYVDGRTFGMDTQNWVLNLYYKFFF